MVCCGGGYQSGRQYGEACVINTAGVECVEKCGYCRHCVIRDRITGGLFARYIVAELRRG